MSERKIHMRELMNQWRDGHVDRRDFLRRAGALGISATLAGSLMSTARAQDASPAASPAAGMGFTSITREEYNQQLRDNFDLQEPGSEGGQVIYGNVSDIDTTLAFLSSDVYTGIMMGHVQETLTGTSVIDGQPVPVLADSWEVADDGVTYTFNINPDANWHDGMPVTAEDCVFSFDATLAEDSLSVRKGTVEPLVASYRAVDEKTFELVSVDPIVIFTYQTTNLVTIVPRHIWQDVPFAEWNTAPGATGEDPSLVVGSGPFRFVEWVPEDHVTIERNPDYYWPEQVPAVDQVIMQVLPEESTAIQALITGQSDMLEGIAPTFYEQLEAEPEAVTLTTNPSTAFNWFSMNQDAARTELFTETPVRQAMLYALDRVAIADTVYLGFATRADGTQPELSIAYAPDQINTIYTYEPDMANTLLDEAGWAMGDDGVRERDGVRFSFECLYSEGVARYEQQLPAMQAFWADVGIEMIPTAVPFQTLTDSTRSGDFEMAVYGFSWGLSGDQSTMFGCANTPPSGFNTMRYCNERYDELTVEQLREFDVERRVEILIEQSNIVNDEVANGIIVFNQDIQAHHTRLQNFFPNGYSFAWGFRYMWVDEEA